MAKDNTIVINNWSDGIAPSSYLGFQEIRGLDIVNRPGIIQINPALEKQSASVITDFPTQFARPGTGSQNMWALDNSQNLYSRTGTTWSKLDAYSQSGSGQGIVYWKDFLFVFRGTEIDVIGPLSSGVSTTIGWQTLSTLGDSGDFNFAVHAKDDILYIGNGRYVASIEENAGQNFAPGTSATYTFTQQHLTLPEGYEVTAMAELGEFIYVGTKHNYRKVADIFPWDKLSQESETPISYNEDGIKQMVVKDNGLIVHAGTRGKIYSGSTLIAKIPDTTTGLRPDAEYSAQPGAMSVWDDKVIFAVLSNNVNFNAVYGVTPKGQLTIEHMVSSGSTNSDVTIGAVLGNSSELLVGWKDATSGTQGVDVTNVNNPYTGDRSYAISQWFRVGTALQPSTQMTAEVILPKKLIANQSITISYRENEDDSFTTIDTFTGLLDRFEASFAPTSANLQIKVSFITPSSTSNNNIHNLEIRIR